MTRRGNHAWRLRREAEAIRLALPVPPSVNGLTSNVSKWKRVKSPAYTAWLHVAGTELELQQPGKVPGRYALTITVQRGATKADLGNLEKAISDLLKTHGVIRDDSDAERITLMWGHAPEGALVELEQVEA